MTTLLPKDDDNNTIPALRLADGGAHVIQTTGTAASNTIAFDDATKVISVYATAPIYMRFGDAGVMTTVADHFFPANTYYDIAISGGAGNGPHSSYISVLSIAADATVYISEKE